jgi:hypothetical protein
VLAAGPATLCPVIGDYFDEPMILRQRLIWTIATRGQLERWEPLVAAWVRDGLFKRKTEGAVIWTAATEHHFALIPPATSCGRSTSIP